MNNQNVKVNEPVVVVEVNEDFSVESFVDEFIKDAVHQSKTEEVLKNDEAVKVEKEKISLKQRLATLTSYVKSSEFTAKVKAKTKELNAKGAKIKEEAVKNIYIGGMLRNIGKALNMVINITCDIILGFVKFVSWLITKIANFTKYMVGKLASAVSLGQV